MNTTEIKNHVIEKIVRDGLGDVILLSDDSPPCPCVMIISQFKMNRALTPYNQRFYDNVLDILYQAILNESYKTFISACSFDDAKTSVVLEKDNLNEKTLRNIIFSMPIPVKVSIGLPRWWEMGVEAKFSNDKGNEYHFYGIPILKQPPWMLDAGISLILGERAITVHNLSYSTDNRHDLDMFRFSFSISIVNALFCPRLKGHPWKFVDGLVPNGKILCQ